MKKCISVGVAIIVLAATGMGAFLLWLDHQTKTLPFTVKDQAEFAAQLGRTNMPTQAVLVPLKMSEPVRLAIGSLGLSDPNQNQQLGDLVTAELTGQPGFNLVERQSLAAILRELNLSLSE